LETKNLREHLEDMNTGGCMDSIDVVHDRDQWRALVNMVMNLRIPWSVGSFLNN
jgi:hypothetical protein